MTQLHKKFVDDQVKDFFARYVKSDFAVITN